jgi:hypothetical protein
MYSLISELCFGNFSSRVTIDLHVKFPIANEIVKFANLTPDVSTYKSFIPRNCIIIVENNR